MRILHLIPTLGGGGAERQLSLLAPSLARAGMEVHVGFHKVGIHASTMEKAGVVMHELYAAGSHHPAIAWRTAGLVRRLRPDIVQTWLLQMDVVGGLAALACRVPLILSERSSQPVNGPGWKARARRLVGSRAAAIVANSYAGAECWRSAVPEQRRYVVRNAVVITPSAMAPPSPAQHLRRGPHVLFAGRFSAEKGIRCMLEAMFRVAHARPEALFILFGEGPERAEAEQRVVTAGLAKRFTFAGYTNQLGWWMSKASVCVSASRFEGNPNVVLEAAAVGCPLVLSDIPSHRELFGDDCALFAHSDSPEYFASLIIQAMDLPGAAQIRAQTARAATNCYNLETVTQAWLRVYRSVTPQV